MHELLTICPTRGRPHLCKRMLDSFLRTKRVSELIFVVDGEDPELDKYICLFKSRGVDYVIQGDRGYLVDMYNSVFKAYPDYRYYHQANDDFIYRTPGWDQAVLKFLDETTNGWGIGYANDLLQGEKLAVASIVSGKLARAVGWLSLPTLKHLFNDNVLTVLGNSVARLFYFPDVVIEHCHVAAGKMAADKTHKETNSAKRYDEDGNAFRAWLGGQSMVDAEKIIKAIHKEAGFKKAVSVCMIIKDDEKSEDIRRALESVVPWADEICAVVNWAHIPNPPRFRRIQGVINKLPIHSVVKYYRWTNFSDMRNKSIDLAQGDYVYWTDCDDVTVNPWMIKDEIFRHPRADTFKVSVISHTIAGGQEFLRQDRLFKRRQEFRFRNCVHEDIALAMLEHKAAVVSSLIEVHHMGNLNARKVAEKNRRNLRLALRDVNRPGAHSLNYFALANCLIIEKKYDAAIYWIHKYFMKFDKNFKDPLTAKMYVLRGICWRKKKDRGRARNDFQNATNDETSVDARINRAEMFEEEKEIDRAIIEMEDAYKIRNRMTPKLPADVITQDKTILRCLTKWYAETGREREARPYYVEYAQKYDQSLLTSGK